MPNRPRSSASSESGPRIEQTMPTTPLSITDLRTIYERMVLIRRFDERTLQLRLDGRIYGTVHPYIGQEAIATAVCYALEAGDRITSNHRGHGHCIAKGAQIGRMLAELFGRVDGYCRGKGGSMHIADFGIGMLGANGIVAAGVPIATGSALTSQLTGDGAVTVAFFGDGATGQGVLYESLNLAVLWSLPVVFVCENNGYASENPIAVSFPTPSVAPIGAAFTMPTCSVDGNDVPAVFDATKEAVDRARSGGGPSFIECSTYRWGAHSQRGAVASDVRPPEEREAAVLRDPIARLRAAMLASGEVQTQWFDTVDARVAAQLDEAIVTAEDSPFPDPSEALTGLFV